MSLLSLFPPHSAWSFTVAFNTPVCVRKTFATYQELSLQTHMYIYIYVYLYVYRYVNIWEYYGFYFKENHGEYPCICLLIHVIRVLGAGCFSNGKSRRLLYRKMVWQNKIYSVSHMVKRNIFHGNAYTHKHIYHMHICVLYIVR